MAFCLPKESAKKFIQSLKDGTIDPEKMIEMTSEQRRTFFEKIVGQDAQDVNAQFESKLLLKDQKRGLVTWAKKVSGISEPIRRDLLTKIDKMTEILTPQTEQAFLNDLASKKLGGSVTFEEATKIAQGAKEVTTLKDKIKPDSPVGSKERLDYGTKFVQFQEFVNGLKGAKSKGVYEVVSGTTKSILAALDNSFFGRQGIKTLYTHPTIWAKDFIKSWGDIGKELKGTDAMTPIKADIYSRPNALNGNYERMKLDIGINAEEAFPSTLPEKIPLLGRLFKASETAFNGAAIRMRADLADLLIKKAQDYGVDFNVKADAQNVGNLINSLTGRGKVNLTPGQASFVNNTFFSIKFLKSNFDTLTAHRAGFGFEKGIGRDFARREAATNLAKILGTTVAILYTAEQLQPGSTKKNPGFITIGNTRFDITGGLASMAMLGYKIEQKLEAQAGNKPKYGQQTGLDLIESFFEGKLSPIAGAIRDYLKGTDFSGKPPTLTSTGLNLVTPLPIQTYQDLQNPKAAPTLGAMIADELGFSTYTPPKK